MGAKIEKALQEASDLLQKPGGEKSEFENKLTELQGWMDCPVLPPLSPPLSSGG